MMMGSWLLCPPVAFIIVFVFVAIAAFLLKRLSLHKDKVSDGSFKPYACGEDNYDHTVQPDYSQFFPFAFFFTIAHVATLILTVAPAHSVKALFMAFFYMFAIIAGILILFER